ncbi:MAG: DUF4150 domain-containing protein [Gammaproteobacteria bacterium]|nr:DUF4150 domain-containing protein [Gammaproteobacteria bacterium]
MTVLVNGRTTVHWDSGGMLTTVDICLTGDDKVPIPYENKAYSRDAENCAENVFVAGNPICIKESYFAKSYGDEAGDGGGIKSGTTQGKAEFTTASENVFVNGVAVVRARDLMVSNNRNTEPVPLMQD